MNLTFTIPACAGCCDPCVALHGDLDIVISDVVLCGTCYDNLGTTSKKVIALVGINGMFTAVWNTPVAGFWQVEIGAVTVQNYSDNACTTPDGAPYDVDVTLFFNCEGNPAQFNFSTSGFSVLEGSVVGLDNPGANSIVCPALATGGVGDGTITILSP